MNRRYVPALNRYLAMYSRNYYLLERLLEQPKTVGQSYHWQHQQRPMIIRLRIIEQTRYTELVEILRTDETLLDLPDSMMTVRVYHDAKMAEVLTSQHISRLMAVYPYPNADMLQRNEKFQVNLFLAELLAQLCQREWHIECRSEESRKT